MNLQFAMSLDRQIERAVVMIAKQLKSVTPNAHLQQLHRDDLNSRHTEEAHSRARLGAARQATLASRAEAMAGLLAKHGNLASVPMRTPGAGLRNRMRALQQAQFARHPRPRLIGYAPSVGWGVVIPGEETPTNNASASASFVGGDQIAISLNAGMDVPQGGYATDWATSGTISSPWTYRTGPQRS